MVTCILLSAGESLRFGSPKALSCIGQEKAIVQIQNRLLCSQVSEIIIVLGAQADLIEPYLLKHTNIRLVYNKDYKFGQTSSFKCGLRAASPASRGVMLLPVDYPFVLSKTFDLIIEAFEKTDEKIMIPRFCGRRGHPPVFPVKLKDEFLNLDNDAGVNTVIHANENCVEYLDVDDEGVVQTFNTPGELRNVLGT